MFGVCRGRWSTDLDGRGLESASLICRLRELMKMARLKGRREKRSTSRATIGASPNLNQPKEPQRQRIALCHPLASDEQSVPSLGPNSSPERCSHARPSSAHVPPELVPSSFLTNIPQKPREMLLRPDKLVLKESMRWRRICIESVL